MRITRNFSSAWLRSEVEGSLFHSAATAATFELVEPTEANEDVDQPLHLWPCPEEAGDEIPVLSHESAEAHEAPVEGTNEDEDARNLSEGRAITAGHRSLGEKV